MTEGELKKRISQIKDDYDGAEGDSMTWAFELYEKVLDEAKREFPPFTKYNEDPNKLGSYVFDRIGGVEKALAWVEKWFGKPKSP